jgi:hypothetical protein
VFTIATFTPTAAPIVLPVAGPVVTAVPSALAVESVFAFAEIFVSAVPELTEIAAGTVALWSTMLIVTATAAATWSGLLLPLPSFSLDSAFGVAFAPETLLELGAPPSSPAFF